MLDQVVVDGVLEDDVQSIPMPAVAYAVNEARPIILVGIREVDSKRSAEANEMPIEVHEEHEMVMALVAQAKTVAVVDFDALHLLQVEIVENNVPTSDVAPED